MPEATVQDAAEAAARPEIVKDAVPSQVRDTGEPPSLGDEVERSKSEAASAAAAAQRRPLPASEDDALDLGSAVLPVLIQRYAGYAVAATIGIVIGWILGRRKSP